MMVPVTPEDDGLSPESRAPPLPASPDATVEEAKLDPIYAPAPGVCSCNPLPAQEEVLA